ncbi:MAG: HAD family hydrolase [Pirellulaceae bacterium]
MQYRALACDYDGTIATHGRVDEATLESLQRFARSGRQLLLVTGRELPELKTVFPELAVFHYVVAENGGLLHVPATQQEQVIADPPPPRFVQELIARGVGPISVGRSIVATWQPHEATVLATIKDLGLDLQVIFNKGAVMILPSGVNKATGLAAALREMKLSRHNVVAVGDAENDHAFLQFAHFGAAVANALPALKERAELVLAEDHGKGVSQLIDYILENDLRNFNSRLTRHEWLLPAVQGAADAVWTPGVAHLCVQGPDESATSAQLEMALSLSEAGYQYCLLVGKAGAVPASVNGSSPVKRPDALPAISVGGLDQLPQVDDVSKNLRHPDQNVHAIIAAGDPAERAACLRNIAARLRTRFLERGRPHVVLFPPLAELRELGLSPHELLSGLESVILPVAAGEVTDDIFPFGSPRVCCDAARYLESRQRIH